MLYDLYMLLSDEVVPVRDSRFYDFVDTTPVVIRFVPAEQSGRFPQCAEGYAGMCDLVAWKCATVASEPQTIKECRFTLPADSTDPQQLVRYALVQLPSPDNELAWQLTIGFAAHELSHLLGATDGTRCPYHEDYVPYAKLEPDPSDAYWWFGVQGVFELRPSGIVWLAMNHRCDESDNPSVCNEVEQIVAETEVN